MKWLLLFLLIPLSSTSQTVHLNDDKIFYEGSIKAGLAKPDLQDALKNAEKNCSSHIHNVSFNADDHQITAVAEMTLTPARNAVNTLQYTLKLFVSEGQVNYQIDDVFLITKARGGNTDTIPSKNIVKDMEVTGPVATATEKILNEIDMRLRELIDRLSNQLNR